MDTNPNLSDEERLAYIKDVQTQHTQQLMALPHVIGISIGQREPDNDNIQVSNEYVIVVLVDEVRDIESIPVDERIPEELDGVPVMVRQVGAFKTL